MPVSLVSKIWGEKKLMVGDIQTAILRNHTSRMNTRQLYVTFRRGERKGRLIPLDGRQVFLLSMTIRGRSIGVQSFFPALSLLA
jgi:hypothetical protein